MIRNVHDRCSIVLLSGLFVVGLAAGARATTVEFEEGINGYTGTLDTYLQDLAVDQQHGVEDIVIVDHRLAPGSPTDPERQALLAFADIIGDAEQQIPLGSQVCSASLTLNVTNAGWVTTTMHRMVVPWTESETWNSMVDGVSSPDEYVDLADASVPAVGTGPLEIDVTQSVQAWANGAANYGWVLQAGTNSDDGWVFSSSEWTGNLLERPRLEVVFHPTAPLITCPTDVFVECIDSTDPSTTGTATATATCSTSPTISYSDDILAGCGNTEILTRTWAADDGNGNASQCDQLIEVVDTTAPDLTVPADLTVECNGAGNAVDLAAWLDGSIASDTCGVVTLMSNFAGLSEDCGATGAATVTWTAEDDCGNIAQSASTFTIEDTTPPEVTCSSTPFDEDDDDEGDHERLVIEFGGSDGCGAVDVSAVLDIGCAQIPIVSGDMVEVECDDDDCEWEFDDGVLKAESSIVQLTIVAVDSCGNESVCVQDLCASTHGDDDDDDDHDDSDGEDDYDDD